MDNKLTGLLGICRRAGHLIVGFDAVKEAICSRKAKVVLTAADLSEKTFATITSILDKAAERAKAIEEGSYDFSLDEAGEEEELEEIPEELLETEEDRRLDERDAEKEERNNRIFDYITFAVFLAALGFAAYKFIIPWIVEMFK